MLYERYHTRIYYKDYNHHNKDPNWAIEQALQSTNGCEIIDSNDHEIYEQAEINFDPYAKVYYVTIDIPHEE